MGNDIHSLSYLYLIYIYILHPSMTVICTISQETWMFPRQGRARGKGVGWGSSPEEGAGSCLTEAVGASAIVRGLQARPTPDTGSRARSPPAPPAPAVHRLLGELHHHQGSLHVDPVMGVAHKPPPPGARWLHQLAPGAPTAGTAARAWPRRCGCGLMSRPPAAGGRDRCRPSE